MVVIKIQIGSCNYWFKKSGTVTYLTGLRDNATKYTQKEAEWEISEGHFKNSNNKESITIESI